MELIRHSKNIHELKMDGTKVKLAMFSDIHWDNPKCDWTLLKRDLDYCLRESIPMMFNGDTFCLMQGKWDPRGTKSDIRPEHNNIRYLDSIIETAVDFFSPYSHLITVVGYGNHECYRPDTEVLTSDGWKNIQEVTVHDLVAVFDKKYIYYETPNAVVSKEADKLVHLEGTFSKQVVSAKHAVMYNDMRKVNADEITSMYDIDLPHGRKFVEQFGEVKNDMVELITAIVMDATLVDHAKYNPNHTKKRIQFKISKPEKIEYLKNLLDSCGIKYTFKEATKSGLNKLQPYYIRVYGDDAKSLFAMLNGVKQLPKEYSKLMGVNFELLVRGIENTDGYKCNNNTIEWRTTSKHNVDVVQEACVLNGYHFTYKEFDNLSGFENGGLQYICRISKEIVKSKKVKITHEEYNGLVYCLNMPSGCFITRVDGKVAFSGNTSILKRHETDVLQRFVDLLNYKNHTNVQTGGYGGWIIINQAVRSSHRVSTKVRYFHGSGGGGIVTRGEINLTRALEMYEDFEVFAMGHIHENKCTNIARDTIEHSSTYGWASRQKQIHLMITGTYKEEFGDGSKGWHVERGAPAKPVGSRILIIDTKRIVDKKNNTDRSEKLIDSIKFPL